MCSSLCLRSEGGRSPYSSPIDHRFVSFSFYGLLPGLSAQPLWPAFDPIIILTIPDFYGFVHVFTVWGLIHRSFGAYCSAIHLFFLGVQHGWADRTSRWKGWPNHCQGSSLARHLVAQIWRPLLYCVFCQSDQVNFLRCGCVHRHWDSGGLLLVYSQCNDLGDFPSR